MIWRRTLTLTAPSVDITTVWRRPRFQKDRWPLVSVQSCQILTRGALLTNVSIEVELMLHALDTRNVEDGSAGWLAPGVIWYTNATRVAIGSELIVQELALLPKVLACDALRILTITTTNDVTATFVIEYELLFTEDHEAWLRKKQRDCHDED